jgi:pimeloyl-ACP methyl ester carboxylesterase
MLFLPGSLKDMGYLVDIACDSGLRNSMYELLPPRVIYSGFEMVGARWFHQEGARIEPLSFGDALWHLERFVLERLTETPTAPAILVGNDEAGALCIAAAPYLAGRISAMVILDGFVPVVANWSPPNTDLAGLPVWILAAAFDSRTETVCEWLKSRDADVRMEVYGSSNLLGLSRVLTALSTARAF